MNQDLDRYLASLDRRSKFSVIRTLKSAPHETTDLVELIDGTSMPGPYIRKRITLDAGIGQAYTRLFEEQQAGKRIVAAPFIFECFETEDSLNVVMEFVQGKTLADWIYELDPSPAFAAYVFPKLCDAVSELHEEFEPPIIHRDLKPSNVMINDRGVKVIDFGIARTYREDAESDTRHFGTPSYAPPEQFGFGQTDERSDIYALGMLLYYCLTERTPTFSMLESEFEDDDVPVPLRRVIATATAFDPANRYASVRELKAAFMDAIDETLAFAPADTGTMEWAPPKGLPAVLANGWAPPAGTPAAPVANAGMDATPAALEANAAPTNEAVNAIPRAVAANKAANKTPRLPKALGIAWNVLVGLAWLLLMAALIYIVFQPDEGHALFPGWVLALEYPILMGGCITFIAYALLYKQYLKQRFAFVATANGSRWVGLCIAGAIACFIAAVAVQGIAQTVFG